MNNLKTLDPDHFPAAAALIHKQSLNPATHCIHASSGEPLENLIDEMERLTATGEMAWVGAWEGAHLSALLGAEFDRDSGRAWMRGPFDTRTDRADPALWMALQSALPVNIRRFDTFLNLENVHGRMFYEKEDFEEKGRVHVYTAKRPVPPERKPQYSPVQVIEPAQHAGFSDLHDAIFPSTFISGAQILEKLDENHQVWTIALEGEVMGYLYGTVEPWADSGYVEFLGVHPDARGRGLGGALLRTGLGWFFGERGLEEAGLTVSDENTNARGLYERSGFWLAYSGINQRLVLK